MARMTSPTKIYVDATSLLLVRNLSGVGHMVVNLIKAIHDDERRDQVEVIMVAPFNKMSVVREQTKGLNVRYKSIPLPAKVLFGLTKFNILPPFDLILGKGVYFFPNFRNFPVWRPGSKSITCVHDIAFYFFPQYVAPRNQRFLQRNMPKWLKRTDLVLAVSESTKRDVAKVYKFPKKRIAVMYNGIDLDLFYRRTQKEIATAKKTYGVKGKYFMFLSTVEPRKNVDGLLAAYDALPEKVCQEYALLLVGASGWLNEQTRETIKAMRARGRTIIWPQTFVPDQDVPALLSGATCLVHPANYEGFGITPLEAMACGTPVIVGRNSSLPEVVGDTGWYVDVTDTPALAKQMIYVIEHPVAAQALAVRAQARAQDFTWHRAGAKLLDCIIDLAQAPSKESI
jgi:glycosyltransferase involved in cell wall biosynthesis